MSCCLVLQDKNNIIIGGDSAGCIELDGRYIRISNTIKKIYRFGKEVMFVGGSIPLKDYIVKNVPMDGNRINKKRFQEFLQFLNHIHATNGISLGIIIAGVDDNGRSYLYQLASENNFELDKRVMNIPGVQVWSAGFCTRECVDVAKRIYDDTKNVEETYINTYKEIACDEVGGSITVYQITPSGIRLLLHNTNLKDGITPKTDQYHAIWADVVVGDLVAGKELKIKNKNDSGETTVAIDGDGITLDGGAITWTNPINSDAVSGLNDFKNAVQGSLGVTKITSDSVISPKIGGGYLCIANDNYSVEIDPTNVSDKTKENFLFCIRNKNYTDTEDNPNNSVIMGVDSSGYGYFDGNIKARGGTIGGFTIENSRVVYSTDNNDFELSINSGYDGIIMRRVQNDDTYNMRITESFIRISNDDNSNFNYMSQNSIALSDGTNITFIQPGYVMTSSGNVTSSDKKVKRDITDINSAEEFILKLKPKMFKYNNGTSNRNHFGFVAQDVEEDMLDTTGDAGIFVRYQNPNSDDESDYICGLRYEEFIAPMVQTIQSQNTQIQAQQKEISSMKKRLEELEKRLSTLQ